MTRHWQHPESQGVVSTTTADADLTTLGFVEVQVAPLDAIVIDRSELPEVVEVPAMKRVEAGGSWAEPANDDPDYFERTARAFLALAGYMRANPPVDEAQVEALYARAVDLGMDMDIREARRLVERGVRVEVTP